MTKPMIRIHNAETDEIIDREMTDQEIEQHEKDKLANLEMIAKVQAAEAAKASALAKLAALGLTADEITALTK